MKLLHASATTLLTASALALIPLVLDRPASSVRAAPPAFALVQTVAKQKKSVGFGTLKGRLVWGGSAAPSPRVLVKKDQADVKDAICKSTTLTSKSLVVDPDTKGIGFAFAYINRPVGTNPDAAKALVGNQPKVVIDQVKCEFVPYATAIHKDQDVVLKSSDPMGHNIHTYPFSGKAINESVPPKGEISTKFSAERLPIKVTCDIHPWMESYLMVFDHPFFAVTAPDGSFEIKEIPAGTQKFVVWQSDVGYVTKGLARGMDVVIKADKTTDVGEIKLDPSKFKPK